MKIDPVNPEIIQAVQKLRSKAFLKTPFVKKSSPKLLKFLNDSARKRIEAAAKPGGLIDSVKRGSKITAALTLHSDSESIPGVTFPNLNIDFAHSKTGKRDAKTLLRRNRHRIKKGTVCFALTSMPEVRNLLSPLGFGVEYVVLLGPVNDGLTGLNKRYAPPINLEHLGLGIERITSPKEIDSVMNIFKKEFGSNPQYGRWAGDPRYLSCIRKSMNASLKKKKLDGFVIRRGRKILGYFGYYITPSGPAYPSIAGVEIILSQAIQKQGIAKTCYRVMLEQLKGRRISLIRGGTSQPAVIGLAKTLKRRPFAHMMLFGSKYFANDHFIMGRRQLLPTRSAQRKVKG